MSAVPHSHLQNFAWSPEADRWRNRYAGLSEQLQRERGVALGSAWQGDALPMPQWVVLNQVLARDLDWPEDWYQGQQALNVFSGNTVWPGMSPFASVYSGHQFGVWAGQLGDGRALLLGELDSPIGPQEVQLKGAGATPYSRRADGRAVLRSSIREFLCSEAMHGLGIPTTRALSLVASPQPVRRETIETAAVVARVAPSFIRFGHFEHFAHSGEEGHHEALQALVDFVVTHHYPELQSSPNRALALLDAVVARTAELMAHWQSVGFCHGVMNTDNMSILGLTIDYGPFGFLDAFDPNHICNHSDDRGRYSWNNQPQIGYWNLRALAQALLPLIPEAKDDSQIVIDVLQTYEQRFPQAMRARWRAKLGLQTEQEDDGKLAVELLQAMAAGKADFTITFRRLCEFRSDVAPDHPANAPVRDLFLDRAAFDAWALQYAERLKAEGSVDAERAVRMRRVNPVYVLRNHMAQVAIQQAQKGDYSEVQRLYQLLQTPFDEQPGAEADAGFPPDWAQAIEVSCSS
ncbi:MAG: YdiU family protein [Aquabacterium sp.]|uniref:protein adenylyltransferase SelO n=1 Tax=Aquabacterium sp. TaxID=1872578 RepID=UPI0012036A00|nr:YdiU family protein [Aquabacterium sp.]TAK97144.1 MAG: YdiU family protein [Aquabacterium sp.]